MEYSQENRSWTSLFGAANAKRKAPQDDGGLGVSKLPKIGSYHAPAASPFQNGTNG